MSDNKYYTHPTLFYGRRNGLLNQAEELIDQIYSTDDIDEKIIKYDNLIQIIKNANDTLKIPKLSPEEKIIYEEERKQYIKKCCLFNAKFKDMGEMLTKIILDECEKLIRQYYLTNKISIKNKICDELNEKIRKYWTIDLPSRNKFKDRFELICKKWNNIKREIKNNRFDVEINGIIYIYQKGNVFDKKTEEFVGTYDSETNVFEMTEDDSDEEEDDSDEEEKEHEEVEDSDEEEKEHEEVEDSNEEEKEHEEVEDSNEEEKEHEEVEDSNEEENSDEEEESDEEEDDSDEEQVEIINEQLFEEDEQISSFILDHTEQYNIHMIHSLCEDVMESCIKINELLNKINN
jgi:hypothetical protein